MEKSPKINKRTPMFIPESRVRLSDCKYPARLLTLLAYLSKSMGLDYHPFESILACVNCNSLIDLATLSYSEL